MTTKVIERLDAHYEVQHSEMGTVYRWCPERVIVECDCGETPNLAASATICGKCGKDHALLIQEVLDPRPEEEIEYPWRYLPGATCKPTRSLGVPREEVERIMLGSRHPKDHEQMGLLLRFPRRKPGEEPQRYTTAPLRPAHKTDLQMPQTECGHRLLSVDPIVSIRVEGGYAARCLLCGTTGPVRGNGKSARLVLSEQMVRDEQ